MARPLFQGFCFYIALAEPSGALDKKAGFYKEQLVGHLTSTIGELGGVTVESYSEACTHVVGTHQMQECCIAATRAGQHVVNIEWAAECQSKGVLLPTELAEYRVLPGPEIPGFKEAVRSMTFTNIEGIERAKAAYWMQATGAAFSSSLNKHVTHLLLTNPTTSGPKVDYARHPGVHISVVLFQWVKACLREWAHIPAGDYMEGSMLWCKELEPYQLSGSCLLQLSDM